MRALHHRRLPRRHGGYRSGHGGVYTLLELLEVNRVIIAIESNKPEAIRVLTEIAENKRDQKDQVKVLELKSRYPQGAEKVLVQACTGRKIPKASCLRT